MSIDNASGPVETSVRAAAARISMVTRVLVVVACTVLLPLGGATTHTLAIVAGVLTWQAVSFLARRWHRWTVILEALPLAALCVLLPWWNPAPGYLAFDDWTKPVASMCVAAAQFYTRPRDGAVYALLTTAAVWWGSTLGPDDWGLHTAHALMFLWQAGLTRCLVVLITRGARRVDALAAATAAARREEELAAARRADVEEHLGVLHDTVAATLTAASAHDSGGPELRLRARADLSLLDFPARAVTFADLATAPADSTLDLTVGQGPVTGDGSLPPYAIRALLAARDEALRNVERHAAVGRAELRIRQPEPGAVEVDVVDDGCGFRPDDLPDGVHLGLRLSVHARMRRAGGSARVVSEPGRGTRVELRWPAR
ncbi:sensor histidine kinase [Actinoplanes couchii]|uniref:Histidine kinase/HSP90-like ATPase domain-containing protein n=1 Tax=Actinoplanes couchii TaxID=403638 RepID=A0ABQ3WZQ7_9ACTN|nr:ATP-binding protein [Actinoplanes couchii]MDR6316056.1 signal transduction histidine kinase [Actinoplanes couchii]GID51671.1 hypothetical protein Aco03nite_000750 [Actinoplanes couchii]